MVTISGFSGIEEGEGRGGGEGENENENITAG